MEPSAPIGAELYPTPLAKLPNMPNLTLKNVGAVFGKKDKAEPKEEEDEIDASEFEDDDEAPKPPRSRRPKDTPFTQQRIAAVNPVVTPRRIIPLYLFLAAIFVIFGAVMVSISARVDHMLIYYERCAEAAPTNGFHPMSPGDFEWNFHKSPGYSAYPQWKYIPGDGTDATASNGTCQIRFVTPDTLPKSVYLSYWIENFYGNHRRYVLSFSEDQIHGQNTSITDIRDNVGINCKPLVTNSEGKQYYPCGLIANAMFNDTFPFELIGVDNTASYPLTNEGITWTTDKDRFRKTPLNYDEIVPPPNWVKQYPDGYNSTNVPNIHEWEEFMNWMRTPAFPTFQRLIRRNDNDSLPAGAYEIDIGLNWPVTEFNGRKAVFMTHGSSIGGKNNFLGTIYLIGGCICAAMALILFCSTILTRRSLGDLNYLSWNRE